MAPIRCCFDQTAVWHSDAARGPSTPSFDHLVGASEQRGRNIEAERLDGLEIEDELELGPLDDRQVCWPFALKNPARINAGFAISVRKAAVAHETASGDELMIMID